MVSKGFTLLELLLVLVIIGLASAMLVPKLNSDVKLFDAQIRELVAILKYSRRMAVVNNRIQQAVIFPYTGQQTNKPSSTKKLSKIKTPWYSKGVKYIWSSNGVKAEIKNKKLSIDFFPQGGATEGQLIIFQGDLKVQIKIDGFTGKVSLKDLESNDE